MHSTEAIEGFAITTVGDTTSRGGTVVVGQDTGDIVMEERRTVEASTGGGDVSTTDEPRTEEGSIGGDTVMGEPRTAEEEHRTVKGPNGGGSAVLIDLNASMPVTPTDSVVEMEIGG
ncbi:hypothetical protein RHGRI_016880 [Rhododendron griersonianum]|uniref:Uncharacterized protein n=1 Tax=Rhododendron griersonianum TaxID=479676 RepID=A0AAV6JVU8_9ERIC|nr:hypothetical protein RHGRI_016880 [Rhododendron griersonianum]